MSQSNDVDGKERLPKGHESGNFYSGSESFFGVFTQAQVYVNGVRLVHDSKVTQQVSDLASQIENNRRRFLHSGDVNFALQELTRITNSYNQRVQAWESEASRREHNKKALSGGALAKMKAELSMVRTKTRLAGRTLTKLAVELHQISGSDSMGAKESKHAGSVPDAGQLRPATNLRPAAGSAADCPPLTDEQKLEAARCLQATQAFLARIVGDSIEISFDDADRKTTDNPNRVEQVWEGTADSGFPVFFAAGWSVINPEETGGVALGRRRLDLRLWLVPKSLQASRSMGLIDGELTIVVRSRKLDAANIRFVIAQASDFPTSDLISTFIRKFAAKYDGRKPTVLVAQFQNLEWIQKRVAIGLDPVP